MHAVQTHVVQGSTVYIYNGILFSCKKEGNSEKCYTWMKLEDIMLSEISQLQKDKYCMVPRVVKFIETGRK